MKSALVTLVLMLATATQPMLAIPASCFMGGERQKMTCSSCCAVNPCCSPSDQQQSSPLVAVVKSTADFLATITWQAMTVPLPIVRQSEFSKFARALGNAHAPSPLALSCIQLI
jgi:hypothetical protein